MIIMVPQSNNISEKEFLSDYDITGYDRPSVTTDIACFSLKTNKDENYRKADSKKLSILLIKRGKHPFREHWALPGGFLHKGETVKECALREIKEETNITPDALIPVGIFSEPERDPRGWILSNAYASILGEEKTTLRSGDDASDAKWFSIDFSVDDKNNVVLQLKNEDILLEATLKETENRFGRSSYDIISNSGLAFDHAKIIACALSALRKEATGSDIVFDFLPEKFTLYALQNVQETLTGITYLTANFRRKFSEFVEETDEYTEGAGHRPAKLFRKK